MARMEQTSVANHLLRMLSPEAFDVLAGVLTPMPLPFRKILHAPDSPISTVYFVESGMVSFVTPLVDGHALEVGVAGREAMIGVPIALGVEAAATEAMVQIEGSALSMPSAAMKSALAAEPTLLPVLLRYSHAFNTQVSQTAACNGAHRIEERLARWLLTTHDRVDGDDIPLTHELLSIMLGVRRSGVSVTAQTLQRAGLIRYAKGQITILDRHGLEAAACECHAVVLRRYRDLLDWEP